MRKRCEGAPRHSLSSTDCCLCSAFFVICNVFLLVVPKQDMPVSVEVDGYKSNAANKCNSYQPCMGKSAALRWVGRGYKTRGVFIVAKKFVVATRRRWRWLRTCATLTATRTTPAAWAGPPPPPRTAATAWPAAVAGAGTAARRRRRWDPAPICMRRWRPPAQHHGTHWSRTPRLRRPATCRRWPCRVVRFCTLHHAKLRPALQTVRGAMPSSSTLLMMLSACVWMVHPDSYARTVLSTLLL